jgi:hypothetical protein
VDPPSANAQEGPSLIRAHIGLVLGAAGSAIILARLLLVSAFNHETAVSLLTMQGTGTAVLGSLLSITPVIPFAALLVVVYLAALSVERTGDIPDGYVAPYLALTVVTVLTAPLVLAGVVAVAAVAIGYTRYGARRTVTSARSADCGARSGEPPTLSNGGRAQHAPWVRRHIAMWFITVGGLALASAPPWLPAERVTIGKGGEQISVVGYVLQESDDELVVLLDSPREVMRYSSDQGFRRSFCEIPYGLIAGGRPLITYLIPSTPPKYPTCAATATD